MRVVIDTSVWISGVFWTGLPHRILIAWRDGEFEVLVSPPLVAELARSLSAIVRELGADPALAQEWLDLIALGCEPVAPERTVSACRDPNDNAVLEAGLAGQADYVVSGDRDLTSLGEHCGIGILAPRQFARLIGCAG